MTRPRLRSPHQPLPVRLLLGLYEAAASLGLAVVVISAYAVLLAWATFLESAYGDKCRAANYAIYETWWFAGLNVLLGLNVLCAALIRFPWKRFQIGFLVVHAGILAMLLGALSTQLFGVDASLPVYEGQSEWRAVENAEHFKLSILPEAVEPAKAAAQTVFVPFVAGPFNWDDYAGLSWFPWSLARRDRGTVYDRDGVKLEVLDYYADSTTQPVPQISLRVDDGSALAGDSRTRGMGQPVELAVTTSSSPHGLGRPYGNGERKTLTGGQRIVFWMTGDTAETAAFSDSAPEGDLGPKGQLVLHAGGKKFHFPVDQLTPGQRKPLGASGLEMELVRADPKFLSLHIRIHKAGSPPGEMLLLADFPDMAGQDYAHHVFGEYWLKPPEASADHPAGKQAVQLFRDAARPRLDVLQGADQKLYYRFWRCPKVEASGMLPVDGRPITLGGDGQPLRVAVTQFVPASQPGARIVARPFDRNKSPGEKRRQVRLRLSVDGNAEEFWLAGINVDPGEVALPPDQRRTVKGSGRRVSVILPWKEIDLGFRVRLQKFNRKLDPGTAAASHYSSLVDLLPRDETSDRALQRDVLITLNEPVNFSDPASGRSFRLYQSSFNGPFAPGDPAFEQIVGGRDARDELFLSQFSVNYDPGRGLKYAGSLLVVGGIVIVFYRKTSFARQRLPAART